MNRLNPKGALWDRPVPDGMIVDPEGLVDSWVTTAEDWLGAVDGTESPTPRAIFEGIELLGLLSRCRPELLEQADETGVAAQLRQRLTELPVKSAFHFPDVTGWLSQAREHWTTSDLSDDDNDVVPEQLIRDLDSLDFLQWFVELTEVIDSSESWFQDFEQHLAQCHMWLNRHASMFTVAEPYIRAVAKTIPESGEIPADETGLLAASAAKYAQLLDACEQAWRDIAEVGSLDFLLKQRPAGRLWTDYQVPEMAYVAGAADDFLEPVEPFKWRSPDGAFEAAIYLPPRRVPGAATTIEMVFGTGTDFSEPALGLVGRQVTLGAATSTIVPQDRGGEPVVLAILRLDDIVAASQSAVPLRIGSEEWE